ncbi:3-dehydro-L-gulonate 2-dehydrogenase [Proteiniclasticum ruminis]|uniref:3-dehydro-L-gulonate 2-dehydrogenase n=1 Tax=Proteiniclasticum ruminis TaxID=398199 RepID=A0A1G8HNZ9_9CLOT|nr:3-dehydro-L-gulonate 2-dehydrogenase [Proteiniclasticum ruminis]SDI08355.1 3-dehydro-L-gulonate 2-dehydrogenase [Proteiniclasticum ruminis]
MRINYNDMLETFKKILLKRGFSEERAYEAAENFAKTSLDGVYSHGVNRFPRIISQIDAGIIEVDKEALCEMSFGAMERWDGQLGIGNLNAKRAMKRACELADQFGIGLVALRNTNHWLRGGAFGWQAAEEGYIGICWTNTMPNMPAYGGKDLRIGNNPFIMAVPGKEGAHIVVDMALSQFSYGKMETLKLAGKELPVPGGYDKEGNLTKDPGKILESSQVLPIGFWKGSGFSLVLDMIASILAGGDSVSEIPSDSMKEKGLSQILLAIDPRKFSSVEDIEKMTERIISFTKDSEPLKEGGAVYYPGESTMKRREENLRMGIPVEEKIWRIIESL